MGSRGNFHARQFFFFGGVGNEILLLHICSFWQVFTLTLTVNAQSISSYASGWLYCMPVVQLSILHSSCQSTETCTNSNQLWMHITQQSSDDLIKFFNLILLSPLYQPPTPGQCTRIQKYITKATTILSNETENLTTENWTSLGAKHMIDPLPSHLPIEPRCWGSTCNSISAGTTPPPQPDL
jgi:hypothetical protein